MDVSKLVSFLDTRTLFFARADSFGDTWEGAISPSDFDAWNEMVVRNEENHEDRKKLIQNYRGAFRGFRRHTYISCWHQNEGESAAMWKLYLKSGEGVALQSSFGRLRRELDGADRRIHLGKVRYIDYKKRATPAGTPHLIGRCYMLGQFAPFIYKRLGFSHENEIRGVFQDAWERPGDPSEAQRGLPITVNVRELVEGVYVAPGTQGWLRDAVQSVLRRFGIDREVRPSEFDEPPIC
jgi:hypothetical protein